MMVPGGLACLLARSSSLSFRVDYFSSLILSFCSRDWLFFVQVKITHTIEPGKEETGCITCFYSPPEYPILAKCPCFDYPEYIVNEIKASQ
jgi:hypothetical protein